MNVQQFHLAQRERSGFVKHKMRRRSQSFYGVRMRHQNSTFCQTSGGNRQSNRRRQRQRTRASHHQNRHQNPNRFRRGVQKMPVIKSYGSNQQ